MFQLRTTPRLSFILKVKCQWTNNKQKSCEWSTKKTLQNEMSTNISYKNKSSTSRNQAAVRGTKRKWEEDGLDENVDKPEDTKMKTAKNLQTENESLKKQNYILKRKNEELNKGLEMSLAILKNPNNILSLHNYILQRREDKKKQVHKYNMPKLRPPPRLKRITTPLI